LREAESNKLKKDKMRKFKRIWSKRSSVSSGRSDPKSSPSLRHKKKRRRELELRSLRLSTEDKWSLNKEKLRSNSNRSWRSRPRLKLSSINKRRTSTLMLNSV